MKSVVADGRFQLPNLRVFLMHRVYLFRDGIDSNNYMLYFYNSSDYKMCISFEHCKFGSRGINVDDSGYAGGALTQSRLKSYVYIYYARMLTFATASSIMPSPAAPVTDMAFSVVSRRFSMWKT